MLSVRECVLELLLMRNKLGYLSLGKKVIYADNDFDPFILKKMHKLNLVKLIS